MRVGVRDNHGDVIEIDHVVELDGVEVLLEPTHDQLIGAVIVLIPLEIRVLSGAFQRL